jgi:RNA polymerase sigma factor (sigma-70 family)
MAVTGSFERWYREEHRRVLAACVAMCGDLEVAVEATDEAFSRALGRWDRVASMDSPGAWVCTVAMNCVRRALRHRRRELLRPPRRPSVVETPSSSPELWEAVRSLPLRQRTAVVVRYVGDFSEVEIAQAMGVARGTVAATLFAARTALAKTLGDTVMDEEGHYAEP